MDRAIEPDRQVARRSLGWAEMVLRRQDMPPDEVRLVTTSTDRVLVRQTLELHLERLEERLIAQKRSLAEVERILAGLPEGRPITASHRDCKAIR